MFDACDAVEGGVVLFIDEVNSRCVEDKLCASRAIIVVLLPAFLVGGCDGSLPRQYQPSARGVSEDTVSFA